MRRAALALLVAGTAAAGGEAWTFAFGNGDRVRGSLSGMRNGSVLVDMRASPRAVTVPFAEITTAEPMPSVPEQPAPRRAVQILRLRDGGALLGRCQAIRQGRLEFEVDGFGLVTVPGRDVTELLDAENAVRAYYRSVAQGPSLDAARITPERFDALWTYLGRKDGNLALQAHRELLRGGGDAVTQLSARLRVQPDAPGIVAGWVKGLDADTAEMREIAYARLRALGVIAEPQLKAATHAATSAGARQRITALLAMIDPDAESEPDPEVLRVLRAIHVLEEIGTPEARALLERIAEGAPGAPTGREAGAALQRLRRAG